MTEIVLTSGESRAVVLANRGALISSLKFASSTAQSNDALWLPPTFSPSSTEWPGGGLPFMFPFAGRVWHQGHLSKYNLDGTTYTMPLHGFSWANPWTSTKTEADRAFLELSSNESSLAIYPFHFRVDMRIFLKPNELMIDVSITHEHPLFGPSKKMPVAIGWHPYLALSKASGAAVDSSAVSAVNSSLNSIDIPAGIIIPVTPQGGAGDPTNADAYLGKGPWPLPKKEIQSLIFTQLTSAPSRLNRCPMANLEISSGPRELMNHIVTWTNEPGEFHCIEPWMSLPDAVATPTGCQWLEAGQSLNVWLKIVSETSSKL
jgi:galactose mutarotase-like enzyme